MAKWILYFALLVETPAPKFKWGVRGGFLPVVFFASSSSFSFRGRNISSFHRLVFSLLHHVSKLLFLVDLFSSILQLKTMKASRNNLSRKRSKGDKLFREAFMVLSFKIEEKRLTRFGTRAYEPRACNVYAHMRVSVSFGSRVFWSRFFGSRVIGPGHFEPRV